MTFLLAKTDVNWFLELWMVRMRGMWGPLAQGGSGDTGILCFAFELLPLSWTPASPQVWEKG